MNESKFLFVIIMAMVVREPAVFLLDEPLSNLDAKLRASAREELERFHRRVGTTSIYVTHDQVEAMAMGDRVMVLNKGVVHQLGTPTEVYDNPSDTFVATFLGSPPMNLVELGEVIVTTLLNVGTTKLRYFARTGSGIGADPRYPAPCRRHRLG